MLVRPGPHTLAGGIVSWGELLNEMESMTLRWKLRDKEVVFLEEYGVPGRECSVDWYIAVEYTSRSAGQVQVIYRTESKRAFPPAPRILITLDADAQNETTACFSLFLAQYLGFLDSRGEGAPRTI